MATYLVTLQEADRTRVRDGINQMVVSAKDDVDAKAICKSHFTGMAGNAAWDAADAVDLDALEVLAGDANALVGWRFQVKIIDASPIIEVEVVGDGTNDTIDEIGAALADALNADAQITNSLYSPGPQTLRVAQGVTDALGDLDVVVNVFPPEVSNAGGRVNSDVNIPGFVVSITDQGVSGDDLTVVFTGDAAIVPEVLDTNTSR